MTSAITPRVGAAVTGTAPAAAAITIMCAMEGGGIPIMPGVKGDIPVDFDFTIQEATLLADVSGSIVVDIWKDTYANFPPTAADSICGAAKPTISGAFKSKDITLTGWTTSFAAGSTLRINVDSATTITRCTLALKVVRV